MSVSGKTPPTASRQAGQPERRRWIILAAIAIAQLMVVLDGTIVNIALPKAQVALHFSTVDRQWIVTAYALAFGSLLLLGGRLGDLFGRKVMFLTGLIGFAGASAVGGAATSFLMLVVARACQGAFGALLAPSALSLLTTTFTDPKERGKAFGIFGSIAGGGGAVGLLLGGVLTEYLSWRWCLYVNLFFAAVAVIGGSVLLRRQARQGRPRLDIFGVLTAGGSMFSFVYGFSNAATHNWHTPSTWGFLAAGGVLLVVFVLWQRRASHPLLPLRVVLDRDRSGAYLAIFLVGAGMFGVFLFLTYYLQDTLGYSPVISGLAFLPMLGMLMLLANTSNIVLMQRTGPKPLVALGMLAAAGGMVWLTRIGPHSGYVSAILGPLLVTGAGFGLVVAPSMNTGTFGVAPSDAGVASALLNTGQQVGGSVGTALLNTLAASATASYLTGHVSPRTVVAGHPSSALVTLATVHGYTIAFWWAAGIFAAGFLVCGPLFRWGVLGKRGGGRPAEATRGTAAQAAADQAGGKVVAEGAVAAAGAAGPQVGGVVRLADGSPVSGAAVTLVDALGRQAGRAGSGPDGAYEMRPAGPGNYILIAMAEALQPQAVGVRVDGRPVRTDLVLTGVAARLEGVAHTATGASVPDARIVLVDDEHGHTVAATTTGPDGRYSLENVPLGSYTVIASGYPPAASRIRVTAGQPTSHDIQLDQPETPDDDLT
ncbi:MAG TPA: MFS transporter [Streptosporangiaceae bacterium]|nr:MFS transporter [Streptosporangiaceae bacterium]